MVTIPTLSQIYTNTVSDLESEFGSAVPSFGKFFIRAVALVMSGTIKIMYLILAKLQKNIFVDLADPEYSGGTLERWGRIKLNRNRNAAIAGEYTIRIVSSAAAYPITIPGETKWKGNIGGTNRLFIIDEDIAITTTPQDITVRALEGGESSRLQVGQTVYLTRPVEDVNTTSIVQSEDTIPQSEESVEDYRQAIIDAFRLEPQGGAASDYRLWAQDVSGVAKVYPYAVYATPAHVIVYVEATEADSDDGKGTPGTAMLDDVSAVFEQDPDTSLDIDERGRRPLGVFDLDVQAVSVKDIDVTIPSSSFTATQQTAIESAIRERIEEIRPYISGADVASLQDDVLDVNILTAEILLTVPGSTFGTVTFDVDSVTKSTYTFDDGEIPYLNSVTFS